ncbi:hypothetical protein AVEN_202996-1 [Araneus ventricosus]|uniref:Uncharacterized protein n=1 Tax=Araneus ventricosus TaxID=182803 RepID=A0A4Y2SBJ5_ARAVE|nr:hypothetical protein AVEN_202996-1 [Araneus ventricosus]
MRIDAGHLPRTSSTVRNALWPERSDGDNFGPSVSLEKWSGVVKTETDSRSSRSITALVNGYSGNDLIFGKTNHSFFIRTMPQSTKYLFNPLKPQCFEI